MLRLALARASRASFALHKPESCLVQVLCSTDITLRITFADAASVPRLVRLEHAPSHTAAFERLGDIMLQPKSLKQLRHLFRCCWQWLASQDSCMQSVWGRSSAKCSFRTGCRHQC